MWTKVRDEEERMQTAATTAPLAFGTDLSDEEVVTRIRTGDTSLFELLMRRHNQRVYRAVRSILRDEAEVEDVMQEAYVQAFAHLEQFLGHARFSTWLIRIAVNEALRRASGRRFTDLDDVVDRIESSDAGPEKRAFQSELRQILETSIDRVPEHFRTVFVLREVEGLSTAETAACLSIPEETVKTRLHRARQQLRPQIDQALGVSAKEAFTFGFERCDRLVTAVLRRLTDAR
jgi:RNA polymerase sigma-70 factor (ECF subfamily)